MEGWCPHREGEPGRWEYEQGTGEHPYQADEEYLSESEAQGALVRYCVIEQGAEGGPRTQHWDGVVRK